MVREVICMCLQQQTAADGQASYGALLYILPKAAWPSHAVRPSGTRPHGRQRQRVIAARLQRILQGQAQALLTELCEEARTLPLPEVMDNEEAELTDDILTQQQANAILRKMHQGQQSASLKSLAPSQLAPATDQKSVEEAAADRRQPITCASSCTYMATGGSPLERGYAAIP